MKTELFIAIILFVIASAAQEGPGSPPYADLPALTPEMLSSSQHHLSGVAPLTLPELEQAALANNPELRATARLIAVAAARRGSAGALDDPTFMYRGWGTPLAKPWDLNQTQHMFMFSQTLPGGGKRELRAKLADEDVEISTAQLETKKREILAEVRTLFYELVRNQDELRFHDEQVALARQGLESARIKYVVGKVPQQDMLKAQIALTRLIEHLVMLQQDSDLARTRLNTALGRDPGDPLDVIGAYSPPVKLPGLMSLEKMALDNRPDLIPARRNTRAALRKVAKAGLHPERRLHGDAGDCPLSKYLHGRTIRHTAVAKPGPPQRGDRGSQRDDRSQKSRV